MRAKSQELLGLLVLGIMFFFSGAAKAQVNSAVANVALNAVKAPVLTVALSAGAVNFLSLTDGATSNPGDTTVTVTTTWSLSPSTGTMDLWAYFSNPAQALTDGTEDIPAANVEASVDAGPMTAFTTVGPFGGSGLLVNSVGISGLNKQGSAVNTLDLNINMTGLALSPSTYGGTMHIQAQAL